jgi:hypothetical protein
MVPLIQRLSDFLKYKIELKDCLKEIAMVEIRAEFTG